jgi:hypothetical protein
MSSKPLHYDAEVQRKVVVYAREQDNGAAERKYTIRAANVHHWKNTRASIFSCKATTKIFTELKKGKYPKMDAASHDTPYR